MTCRRTLINEFYPHPIISVTSFLTAVPLIILLHGFLSRSSTTPSTFTPQGLCICSSLYLEFSLISIKFWNQQLPKSASSFLILEKMWLQKFFLTAQHKFNSLVFRGEPRSLGSTKKRKETYRREWETWRLQFHRE